MHLIEAGPYRLLLDCGLNRGPSEENRLRNRQFPFDPTSLDAVILSHAHVDHCGNLPNLVRQGFHGPIFCTPATQDLIDVMLADSARIQEEDAQVAALSGQAEAPDRRALYTRKDAERVVRQCVPIAYDHPATINPDIQVEFRDAGHILGSAIVQLTFQHRSREHRIAFTGDLGRRGLPYLRDPSSVPPADLIICESTYGGRTHDSAEVMAEKMADIVRRTVAREGKVLIPAFSLGRTQLVVHYLRAWMKEGILPRLPIFIDSPLASDISLIYESYPQAFQVPEEGPPASFVHSPEEGRGRSLQRDPCVIVASGGMCEGGRILQHLRWHIDDPRSSVVLVSYQAPTSVGARLLELQPTVRFHGRNWNKWIEVAELKGFSGHADQNDFLALLGPAAGQTGRVRLVHGEPDQADALAERLRGVGFPDVGVPDFRETVRIR
jgi:metallo-beta-lactamase family protein